MILSYLTSEIILEFDYSLAFHIKSLAVNHKSVMNIQQTESSNTTY